jgi:hypothetical protein
MAGALDRWCSASVAQQSGGVEGVGAEHDHPHGRVRLPVPGLGSLACECAVGGRAGCSGVVAVAVGGRQGTGPQAARGAGRPPAPPRPPRRCTADGERSNGGGPGGEDSAGGAWRNTTMVAAGESVSPAASTADEVQVLLTSHVGGLMKLFIYIKPSDSDRDYGSRSY